MELVIAMVLVTAYVAYRHWLQLERRRMVHRERLAAIEKGVDLPPLEQEVKRRSFNVQRFLLLAGLVWLSLGIAAFVTLSALLAHPIPTQAEIPHGIQWISLAPICVGVSHLIVYVVGNRREN